MLLSAYYIAICTVGVLAVLSVGAPQLSVLIYVASVLVATLGVPHGGLDHWTGRRLLASRFRDSWWMIFFPGYLLLSAVVVVAWLAFPLPAVIGFFLLSAWHFGREDQHRIAEKSGDPRASEILEHVSAVALGGLVIWVPALVRPEEMIWMLRMIVPANYAEAAEQIVFFTRAIAVILSPIALVAFVWQLHRDGQDLNAWVPVATAAIAAFAPILVSFTTYFCLWHSILGLSRLRTQEGLTVPQFVASILPLSVMAVAGVIVAGWFFRQSHWPSPIGTTSDSLQVLFIGLSAIAVPHLLLHEWADRAQRAKYRPEAQS